MKPLKTQEIAQVKRLEKGGTFAAILVFNLAIFILCGSWVVYQSIRAQEEAPMNFVKVAKPASQPKPAPPKLASGTGARQDMDVSDLVQPPPMTMSVVSTSVPVSSFTAPVIPQGGSMTVPSLPVGTSLSNSQSSNKGLLVSLGTDDQGSANGQPFSPFGSKDEGDGSGLKGYFYHLNYARDGSPNGLGGKYYTFLYDYIDKGFPANFFDQFSKGSHPLYLTQMVVPNVPYGEAYKAFCDTPLEDAHDWVADYKGNFTVPISGTYRFVGSGNDMTSVAINNKLVFYAVINKSGGVNMTSKDMYGYHANGIWMDCPCGEWVKLDASTVYHIEVFIGDDTGDSDFLLLVQNQNKDYPTAPGSNFPILPPLRFSRGSQPLAKGQIVPYDNDTDLGWTVVGDDLNPGDSVPNNN